MKKFLRPVSIGSFVLGLAVGIVGTSVAATRAGSSIFPDVPVGAYYDSAIGEMYGLGIITGFGDGTFRPNDNLTRGQAAVLLQRLRNEVLGIEESSSSSTRSRSSRSSSSSSTSSSSVSSLAANEHGRIRFTTSTYTLEEDDGDMTISVVRTGGDEGIVSVEYKLVEGTATADEDFERQEGTLVFQSGETSKTFQVKVLNDTEQEGDETITLELSNPTGGAELTDPSTSTFTIEDDETVASSSSAGNVNNEEGVFRFSAIVYTVDEAGDEIIITVERTGGDTGSVSVGYAMSDGTAQSGSDYSKSSGTLSFGDGVTTKSFTIGIEDNNDIGGNKTVNLVLQNPTGGAILHEQYKSATLIIDDDEVGSFGSGAFRFTDNEFEVVESDRFVDITVQRQSGSMGEATVQYKTSDGTADVNSDYKEAEGTLTFRDGETTKFFTVEVLEDSVSDGGESVNLTLQNPNNASLATPSIATLYLY